jgi:hypothetical protein
VRRLYLVLLAGLALSACRGGGAGHAPITSPPTTALRTQTSEARPSSVGAGILGRR